MYWNDIKFLKQILLELNHKETDYRVKMLTWAGELLYHKKREETYVKTLIMYTRRYTLDKELDEVWSYILSKWRK